MRDDILLLASKHELLAARDADHSLCKPRSMARPSPRRNLTNALRENGYHLSYTCFIELNEFSFD